MQNSLNIAVVIWYLLILVLLHYMGFAMLGLLLHSTHIL